MFFSMACGLDSYEYLKWLFDSLLDREMPDFAYDDLPWSSKVPTELNSPARAKTSKRKRKDPTFCDRE